MFDSKCKRVPPGWACKKKKGHEGPCQVRPSWWHIAAKKKYGKG